MLGAVARKFFGSSNDRRVRKYQPRVDAINALEPEIVKLTDEELRERFLAAPFETLSSFRESGLELTDAEMAALTSRDQRLWRAGADWIDARLQRCCLSPVRRRS